MANGIRTGDPHGFNKGHSLSSMKVPEFDKHLKKARGHIGRNVVEITIKMKTIVRKGMQLNGFLISWIMKISRHPCPLWRDYTKTVSTAIKMGSGCLKSTTKRDVRWIKFIVFKDKKETMTNLVNEIQTNNEKTLFWWTIKKRLKENRIMSKICAKKT